MEMLIIGGLLVLAGCVIELLLRGAVVTTQADQIDLLKEINAEQAKLLEVREKELHCYRKLATLRSRKAQEEAND